MVSAAGAAELARMIAQTRQSVRPFREDVPRDIPDDWQPWLATMFPDYIRPPFAEYHAEFWEWAWSIQAGKPKKPFVAIWPRGFAKSTSAEVACAVIAARSSRSYALYVCSSQDQADSHVQNIAELLESTAFATTYTAAGRRAIGKYGPKAWNRKRLRTDSGLTIDALGFDTAARGLKIGKHRPDLLIFDDIDDLLDSPAAVAKKVQTLTKTLLPTRAPHAAVLVAQNLIHENGIVAQLADGRAKFLADRHVSGPHPAVAGLVTEEHAGRSVIVAGESTWPAISLEALQLEIDEIGITAFLTEKQHEVGDLEGGIFGEVAFQRCTPNAVPALERVVVWVDPAVTATDKSDANGIQADGRGVDGKVYRLRSWEQRASPQVTLHKALTWALELGAEAVGVETDQGGDTWELVYRQVFDAMLASGEVATGTPRPKFREAKAGSVGPKSERAHRMLAAYERGQIVHVMNGTHDTLERALRRYLLRKPYDLVDASFWAWNDCDSRAPMPAPVGFRQQSAWNRPRR